MHVSRTKRARHEVVNLSTNAKTLRRLGANSALYNIRKSVLAGTCVFCDLNVR